MGFSPNPAHNGKNVANTRLIVHGMVEFGAGNVGDDHHGDVTAAFDIAVPCQHIAESIHDRELLRLRNVAATFGVGHLLAGGGGGIEYLEIGVEEFRMLLQLHNGDHIFINIGVAHNLLYHGVQLVVDRLIEGLGGIVRHDKLLRESAGYSRSQLAKMLDVTRSSVNAWEMGLSTPTTQYVAAMSRLFHVSADYLLGIDHNHVLKMEDYSEEELNLVYSLLKYIDARKSSGA